MPVIQVHMIEGRTETQCQDFIRGITEVAITTLGVDRQSVRVMLIEHPKTHYAIGGKTALELGR